MNFKNSNCLSNMINNKIIYWMDRKRLQLSIGHVEPFFEEQDNFNDQLAHISNEEYMVHSCRIIKILSKYGIIMNLRLFNTILLIYTFNEVILEKDESSIEKEDYRLEIINAVDEIYEIFINFDISDKLCILSLVNKLKRYEKFLNLWKEVDKISLVETFATMYYKFDEIIQYIKKDRPDSELYMDELEKIENLIQSKNNILDKIKKVNGYEIFKTIKPSIMNYDDPKLEKELKESVENSYWDLLKVDLTKVPPDFTHLTNLLNEIKTVVISIDPQNKKLIQEMNIDFDNFDTHVLINCINIYFDHLIKIQDLEMTEETAKHYKLYKAGLIEGNELFEFVPISLKHIVKSFYKIYEDKYEKADKIDLASMLTRNL